LTKFDETKTTRLGETAVGWAVSAFAVAAVAASLYQNAIPAQLPVKVQASVSLHGDASTACVPLDVPKFTLDKKIEQGKTLFTAWVSYQRCVDTFQAAQVVRAMIVEKLKAEEVVDFGLSVEFYDPHRPFRHWSVRYNFDQGPQIRA
jgi:hypothetical protein